MSKPRAFFLSPEAPVPGAGGGGLRSASLLEYLHAKYDTQVFSFDLPYHSKTLIARIWRNSLRFVRGAPPLLDRFSGFESQLDRALCGHYDLGIIEHFWCAPYARTLRPFCDRLVLDLHNIESRLAETHAGATRGLESMAGRRFASAYRREERAWIPKFDVILATSEDDRRRVDQICSGLGSAHVIVYPNALPEIARPDVPESNSITFSGNLEYHPNMEAVRWFHTSIWPQIRAKNAQITWKLIGRNEQGARAIVAGDDRVTFTGPVENAIAEIASAKVCVVPLISGSGTRFKILEAWAAARAVVSTTLGAEGLGAVHEKHLLIADDADSFARAVLRLLDDAELRARLGEKGRDLYLDRFTWATAWAALESAGI